MNITERNKEVIKNLPLVHFLVNKYYNNLIDFQPDLYNDLIQIGCIGLIKAIEKYDKNISKFTFFASFYIKGEIQHYLRDKHQLIRVRNSKSLSFCTLEHFLERENNLPDRIINNLKCLQTELLQGKLEDFSVLYSAIALLPSQEKLVLENYLTKKSVKEICQALNKSHMYYWRHYKKAIANLKQILNDNSYFY